MVALDSPRGHKDWEAMGKGGKPAQGMGTAVTELLKETAQQGLYAALTWTARETPKRLEETQASRFTSVQLLFSGFTR